MSGVSTGSLLMAVGLQARVMPRIMDSTSVVSSAILLLRAARLLARPSLLAEQSHLELGDTLPALARLADAKLQTDDYDASRAERFADLVPEGAGSIVLFGAEAQGCIMQTGIGLLQMGKSVAVVADAVGAQHASEKDAALDRLARRGAEIVTAEMTVLEWLGSHAAPRSRDVLALVEQFRGGIWRHEENGTKAHLVAHETAGKAAPQAIVIGAALRKARLARALTLAKLAEEASCSLSQLSKIENNKTVPTLPLLYRLAQVLGRDVESLLASIPPRADE